MTKSKYPSSVKAVIQGKSSRIHQRIKSIGKFSAESYARLSIIVITESIIVSFRGKSPERKIMEEKENRKYKNSVFVDLFYEDDSAEENDIALYNALHEEPLPKGTKIQKIRVENVLYMNFQNDISFGVEGKVMVFGEHQSSINENMPLRNLMYVGRAYEQVVPVRDRYKKKMLKLPKPEFYTFYNGKEAWEKEKILRLSDAFVLQEDDPMLELTVKVININQKENHEILQKCSILREYSEFVELVRKYKETGEKDPYRQAIMECIEKGILKGYLERKSSEVVNMLVAEYDYDLDIEVQREEAYEEGMEKGIEKGIETGTVQGRQEKMRELIQKKLEKKKSVQEIAGDLEENSDEILRIIKEYDLDFQVEKNKIK